MGHTPMPAPGGQLTGRRDADAVHVRQLLAGALLDGDVGARLQPQVAGGAGRRHVEGDPVVLGGDGQLVGAHLVSRVPVGHHAVGAYHHGCQGAGSGGERAGRRHLDPGWPSLVHPGQATSREEVVPT